MKTKIGLLITMFVLLFVAACGPSEEEKTEALAQRVADIIIASEAEAEQPVAEKEYWAPSGSHWSYLTNNDDYAEYEREMLLECATPDEDGDLPTETSVVVTRGGENNKDVTVFVICEDFFTDLLGLTVEEIEEAVAATKTASGQVGDSDMTATPSELATPTPKATPAPEPTATADPEATPEPAVEEDRNEIVLLDGLVTLIGYPEVAEETVRWGPDNTWIEECGYGPLAWILCDPGVISFDYPDDDDVENKIQDNPSAVWTGGAQVDLAMTTLTEQFYLPGNGYMKATMGHAIIRLNGNEIRLMPEDGTVYVFISRGEYAEEGGHQTPVEFEVLDEEFRGGVKVMRYPIELPDASSFYGYTHFMQDVDGMLSFDNCVFDGCQRIVVVATDENRENATVATYTPAEFFSLVFTNSRSE